jgi:hypothetical protein
MMKHFLILIMVALAALTVDAQNNSIYIEDFEIVPDSVMEVPVILANESPARGLQFIVTLPQGLSLESSELTRYSESMKMNLVSQPKGDGHMMFIYSMAYVSYPVDTAAIMTLSVRAASDFKGGNIVISKGLGSTLENESFSINCGTTTVTVPASVLIGIPMDQHIDDNVFF